VTVHLKGETKPFFEQGAVDGLLEIILALGSELSAVSDKLDTVIDLLSRNGIVRLADVEAFAPDDDQQARRDAARQRLVQALLAPYQLQADALAERAARRT
jgi:hypothetical protein